VNVTSTFTEKALPLNETGGDLSGGASVTHTSGLAKPSVKVASGTVRTVD
jgi:hypothetical protein